ncbi:hypothetical protein ES703_113034 [subsurface metagenome]
MHGRLAKSFKMFVLVALCMSLTLGVLSGLAMAQEKKVIRCFVQAYTPRERMEADRWDPPQYYWKLEQEYEKLHPDIDIQFLKPIVGEYEAWFVTQMTGETAPETLWRHIGAAKADYVKGWYLDFTPYLEKPNPYVEGNDHWKDIFIPAVSETGYLCLDVVFRTPVPISSNTGEDPIYQPPFVPLVYNPEQSSG